MQLLLKKPSIPIQKIKLEQHNWRMLVVLLRQKLKKSNHMVLNYANINASE